MSTQTETRPAITRDWILIVGVMLALLLGGAGLWVRNNPPHKLVRTGQTDYVGRPIRARVPNQTLADQRSDYLFYAAGAVLVVPILLARTRKDPRPGPTSLDQ